MRLMELFSQPENSDPRLNSDINYLDDLKFFIDNNNDRVSNVLFPAIKKHRESPDDEKSYKFYVQPLKMCAEEYVNEYQLEDIKDEIFSNESILELAKRIAEEQLAHIRSKEYAR